MKLTTYKCDHCNKVYENYHEGLIVLGADDSDNGIFYRNPSREGNCLIEMNRMHDLHFCNKECFTNFFFSIK